MLLEQHRCMLTAHGGNQRRPISYCAANCHAVCSLVVLPLSVVTAGAFLIGTGLLSASSSARNFLMCAGIAVYTVGVVYFLIINLVVKNNCSAADQEADSYQDVNEDFISKSEEIIGTLDTVSMQELCPSETAI